jgi:glutathione synthase/RimK-type ligase-like ATP-grasp enzyme
VLLLGRSVDPHLGAVRNELQRRGQSVASLFIDRVAHEPWCDLQFSDGGLSVPDHLAEISGVLARRIAGIANPHLWAHVREEVRYFAMSEAEAALFGVCHALGDATWINDFRSLAGAALKSVQLRAAQRVGLRIPETLITDEPDSVRTFFDENDGRIVYKAQGLPVVFSDEKRTALLYTSRIESTHLSQLDGLLTVPGLFQEEVPRDRELRLIAVDDQLFAVEVHVPADAPIDWHRGLGSYTEFSRCEVDDDLERRVRELLASLGLRYGALDLIVRPDGEPVFLEVNPSGAYLWLEEQLGLPITAALADALLG